MDVNFPCNGLLLFNTIAILLFGLLVFEFHSNMLMFCIGTLKEKKLK